MATNKATQTVIDDEFEAQFKASDYQRAFKSVESSSRKADKLIKEIAISAMEVQIVCTHCCDEIPISISRHWVNMYQMAKDAYYCAVASMGFYARQISHLYQTGKLNTELKEPEKTPAEIAEMIKAIKESCRE